MSSIPALTELAQFAAWPAGGEEGGRDARDHASWEFAQTLEQQHLRTLTPKPSGRPRKTRTQSAAFGRIIEYACRCLGTVLPAAAHLHRSQEAGRNPQLRMKLENMPVPLTPELKDGETGPVLEASRCVDLSLIRELVPTF